ncbi:MAG: hypothetical protein B6D62_00215 [Candidatus Cloacimonas sp. 4484_275]|nr:MAG: hypothetical protein B6D62_00215 [Candidatus Cloacimonas sp. 4484_275]
MILEKEEWILLSIISRQLSQIIKLSSFDGFVKSRFKLENIILSGDERYNEVSSYEILRLRSE